MTTHKITLENLRSPYWLSGRYRNIFLRPTHSRFVASTGEIGLAGVMAVAMQIPNIALAYPLATLSDSLPRKPMIVIAGAVNILSILTLALMIEQHMLSWFAIAALGFVSGVFSELAAASEAGYIPQLLGRETFFRITHVVKFAREYPQSLRPLRQDLLFLSRVQRSVLSSRCSFSERQLFHTQRCHP